MYPTQTVFVFGGKGIELTVTFTTPLLVEDVEVMSRPVTYITFSVPHRFPHLRRLRNNLMPSRNPRFVRWTMPPTGLSFTTITPLSGV